MRSVPYPAEKSFSIFGKYDSNYETCSILAELPYRGGITTTGLTGEHYDRYCQTF